MREIRSNKAFTRFEISLNGLPCGDLVSRTEDFNQLTKVIGNGMKSTEDSLNYIAKKNRNMSDVTI